MAKALVTPPAGLPVTLGQIKAHLRIETDAEDVYLQELNAAATAAVEAESGRVLLSQVWRIYLDAIPADGIVELPLAPVCGVGPVTAYNAAGTGQPVPAAAYLLDRHGEPARLFFREQPDDGRALNGLEIDVAAGYGGTGADVPDQLNRAILMLCAHWHIHRGAASEDALAASRPAGFAALLAPFRRMRL